MAGSVKPESLKNEGSPWLIRVNRAELRNTRDSGRDLRAAVRAERGELSFLKGGAQLLRVRFLVQKVHTRSYGRLLPSFLCYASASASVLELSPSTL